MNQIEWEDSVKEYMKTIGWECDTDNEKTLGFNCFDGPFHWMRDYNKKSRRFVQFNGNQIVSFASTKECQ